MWELYGRGVMTMVVVVMWLPSPHSLLQRRCVCFLWSKYHEVNQTKKAINIAQLRALLKESNCLVPYPFLSSPRHQIGPLYPLCYIRILPVCLPLENFYHKDT